MSLTDEPSRAALLARQVEVLERLDDSSQRYSLLLVRALIAALRVARQPEDPQFRALLRSELANFSAALISGMAEIEALLDDLSRTGLHTAGREQTPEFWQRAADELIGEIAAVMADSPASADTSVGHTDAN